MDIDIRTVTDADFEAYARAVERAFGAYPRQEELDVDRLVFESERSLAAMDGQEIVGTAAAFSLELSVPGAVVPMAGATAVGVAPTHRRRGILTQLMRRQLDDVRERGEPVAGLWASESSIYGRFGYGPAAMAANLEIERQRSAFATPHQPAGRIELIDKEEALREMPAVYDRVLSTRPGMWRRTERWWTHDFADLEHWRRGAGELFYAVHRSEGATGGYVAYRTKHEWGSGLPEGTLTVRELMADTREAYLDLWRYCFDVDLMSRIEAAWRAVDEPLFFLLAEPRRLRTRVSDSLWIRLVDVPAALVARQYLREGRLIFELNDPFCPWNEGRYELVSGPGGTGCRRTDAEASVALEAASLAAAYLGGQRFATMAEAGRVEGDRETLRLADAMFGWDRAPWCPQVF